MRLFKPAWESDKRDKRGKAVAEISDQALLAELVQTSKFSDVVGAAYDKIRDPAVKAELLLKEQGVEMWSEQMKLDFVDAVTDGDRLVKWIRLFHINEQICNHALEKIKDQKTLATIVKLNVSPLWLGYDVRYHALNKLLKMENVEPAVIDDLFVNVGDSSLRNKLKERLDLQTVSQEVWLQIAANKRLDWPKRAEAIERVTNQDFLLKIATDHTENENVAWRAVDGLHSQQALAEVVLSSSAQSRAQEHAADRLKEPEALLQAILNETVGLGRCLRAAECIFQHKMADDETGQKVVDAIANRILQLDDCSDRKSCSGILVRQVLKLENGQERFGVKAEINTYTDGDGIEYPVYVMWYKGTRI